MIKGKIKKNYAERVGVAAGSVRLIFDGSPVSDTDTPRGLSLEDDDVIEAFVEQTGGHHHSSISFRLNGITMHR